MVEQARGARRTTRQQRVVLDQVERGEAFRSAQEVHRQLHADGEAVGLATVYRNLQRLVDDGLVDTVRGEDGEVRYRRCRDESHHHHLVCRDCGRVVEVRGPAVERWAEAAAEQHGFTDVSHTLELFGRCRECASRA
jgi:Fur family ferric uptake transcriptional regulator